MYAANYQNNKYKTQLCRHFSATGTCSLGAKCMFAHGQQELRGNGIILIERVCSQLVFATDGGLNVPEHPQYARFALALILQQLNKLDRELSSSGFNEPACESLIIVLIYKIRPMILQDPAFQIVEIILQNMEKIFVLKPVLII